MKYKKILLSLALVFILTACNSGSSLEAEDIVCYYENNVYIDVDDNGISIGSIWYIPDDAQMNSVKIFFGDVNDTDKTPNKKVKVYEDESYNMFLVCNYELYAKADYTFPDYRNGDEIEKIIISSDECQGYFDTNCVSIVDESDIDAINQLLISASNASYSEESFCEEKAGTEEDYFIGIKYKNFSAVYSYGYVSPNTENKLGLCCTENSYGNNLYCIDEQTLNLLNKYI